MKTGHTKAVVLAACLALAVALPIQARATAIQGPLIASSEDSPPLKQAVVPADQAERDVASYQLAVRLDPDSKQLHGSGRISYRNPSGDTLGEIWLHLYLNAFRSRDTQWMREAGAGFRESAFDPEHPGWIRVEELRVAQTGEALPLPGGGDTEETNVRVPLPQPIGPHGTLDLEMRWTAQLPKVFARTGFADDFVMAGQWYPKLAVYDRGRWDTEPWHANAEFFADFGSYDLAVTVPESYVTGASGVRVGEAGNGDGTKTVRYRAEGVTDVAWTAWPQFRVFDRKLEAAGVPVELELLLPPGDLGETERHIAAAKAALDGYGGWYGAYPWPKLTVVVPPENAPGAGGMEYPTLVTTGSGSHLPFGWDGGVHTLEVVTVHEIAHEWFPMQVQSDEAADPWLDEGFADYMTTRLLDRLYGTDGSMVDLPFARIGYAETQRVTFLTAAAREPLAQPAWAFPDMQLYAATIYAKGSLALLSLQGAVGDERFTTAMRGYADRWRWHHPTIRDFQAALEEGTDERLDWFFDAFVYGRDVIDFEVASADATKAVIVRRGEATYPVDVEVTLADGTTRRQRWDGSGERTEIDGGGRPLAAVRVDPDERIALQLDRLNDGWVQRPDPAAALAITNRWLGFVQVLLQLLGQVG